MPPAAIAATLSAVKGLRILLAIACAGAAAWAFAGVLSVFGLVTGRNVAVVLFAAAAIAIFWLSVNAPYWREVAGFPVGVGLAAIGVVLFG